MPISSPFFRNVIFVVVTIVTGLLLPARGSLFSDEVVVLLISNGVAPLVVASSEGATLES